MYVIALVGKTDSGKSQTLNIVYQLLLFDGYKRVENYPHLFKYRGLGAKEQRDFIDIVQKKGRVVGIVTMGDYLTGDKLTGGATTADYVKNLLKELFDAGCAIAICACTERNMNIISQELNDYPNIVFPKTSTDNEPDERIVNGIDAQNIFNHI